MADMLKDQSKAKIGMLGAAHTNTKIRKTMSTQFIFMINGYASGLAPADHEFLAVRMRDWTYIVSLEFWLTELLVLSRLRTKHVLNRLP
jgi:hypothetical protein